MVSKINESIFIDTAFFKALIDTKDDFHEDAVTILERLNKQSTQLITSNFILDETITLIRVKCGRDRVKDLQRSLLKLKRFKIIRVISLDEKNAWEWFWNDWSRLSFTDCVSFALMKRLGLTRVATFDNHFQKAGFQVEK
ncbi:PIN domain-containing protein [Candidatus Gottesmanbacteria bacterium]|nr:PIN domain-containing protein [Candidatus Gottesmanbacteria bacterium]